MKINSSGKLKSNEIDFDELSRVLGIKTQKTIKTHLDKLIQRNWIGYSSKSKIYFIRGFDKISQLEKNTYKASAVFSIEYFSNFKAWCGAVFYAYLYRKSRGSKYYESASKLKKASQTQNAAPLFLPIATTGFSKYYQVSVGQASKLKTLAFKAGFIDVQKNFENTTIPLEEKNLYKKYGDLSEVNRMRVRKGQIVLQQTDTILPHISLSKRKKWKTYS